MTANELAQLIEDAYPRGFVKDAADLLRQLQAELDDCKAQLILQKNDLLKILYGLVTANELADELNKMFRGEEYDRLVHEIPNMLRQQAKEIEALKNANRFIQNFAEEQHQRAVALEMRELTDEEILDLCPPNHSDMMNEAYTIDFARAILKKASDK